MRTEPICLRRAYFPEGAIHLAVIDPQVGTERRRVVIKGERSFYVDSDNGLLIPAAQAEGISKAVSITNRDYMLKEVSSTFDERDVLPRLLHIWDWV